MSRYIIQDKQRTGSNVLQLTMRVADGAEPFQYTAGQYVSLGFKKFGRRTPMRSFSLISSPYNTETLQVAMRIAGNFTQAAARVPVGAPVYVLGPFGDFTINPQYDRNVVMIAGGSRHDCRWYRCDSVH